ncbi:amidase [Panacibacter ginsenosidivorans]|uniref:Amidase n=1 Tax=Panacibacter ginsenosidivorans TaxID=1813871 RepID=A0A5B8VID5_9BACT|nr:amidase [Panacibacter ginsenosidivorans]QEC70048.1 amidase [Panacibacter ginsenosidivorans]
MNRRNFLRNSSLAGFTISTLPALAFDGKEKTAPEDFFEDNFQLSETTVDALQQQMQSGKLTAVAITRMYLQRIEAIDKNGPKLNAVIEINPDAIAIAQQMDNERKAGKLRGQLHGIPVLIKDNINTGDKMMTTAGVLALKGNIAKEDAFIVARLREAGAVLLGKTNLSEWANFRSTRSTSGWSSRGGQTKCPYILDRNPSGSSAGSGSAAAANLCCISIGTETDGSVVSPSSVNGLVGIKPTVGLWSRSGIIPISATQDTAGPMCRTVKDAAILLGALTGIDNNDAVTQNSNGKSYKDYTQFLQKDGLKGKKIGIEKSHLEGNENIVALYKQAIELMKKAGAEITEVEIIKPLNDATGNAEFLVLLYEFKDGVNKYLAAANAPMKNLDDVISFNKANEAAAMPFFKQETLIFANSKGDLNSTEYIEALAKTLASRKMLGDLMQQNNLDALCGVTNGLACCIDLINGDYDTGFSLSTPAAISGFPHITVPMGFVHDLPIGISFFATAYTEPKLLSIAYAYEQLSKVRKAPMFKKDLLK